MQLLPKTIKTQGCKCIVGGTKQSTVYIMVGVLKYHHKISHRLPYVV